MVAFPQETLIQIFEELIDDSRNLKYCSAHDLLSYMLVNHEWHRAASQILWRDPFIFIKDMKQHSSLIAIYLQCLPEVSRVRIAKRGIQMDSVSTKPPIFDYPAMLKRLDWAKMYLSLSAWLLSQKKNLYTISEDSRGFLMVLAALMKNFVNKASIKHLIIKGMEVDQIDKVGLLIFAENKDSSSAQDFLRNLTSLRLTSDVRAFKPETAKSLIRFADICHKIEELVITSSDTYDQVWEAVIKAQTNLRRLSVHGYHHKMPLTQEALRDNGQNLTHLRVPASCISMDAFVNCSNLQYLDVTNHNMEDGMLQLLNSSFPKLEHFFLNSDKRDDRFHFFSMDQDLPPTDKSLPHLSKFIRNTYGSLKTIDVVSYARDIDSDALLEYSSEVAKCCPELSYYRGFFAITRLSDLFRQCPHLNSVIILDDSYDFCDISSSLQESGEFIPKNLGVLTIPQRFKYSPKALDSFLESCLKKSIDGLSMRLFNSDNSRLVKIMKKYKKKYVVDSYTD